MINDKERQQNFVDTQFLNYDMAHKLKDVDLLGLAKANGHIHTIHIHYYDGQMVEDITYKKNNTTKQIKVDKVFLPGNITIHKPDLELLVPIPDRTLMWDALPEHQDSYDGPEFLGLKEVNLHPDVLLSYCCHSQGKKHVESLGELWIFLKEKNLIPEVKDGSN